MFSRVREQLGAAGFVVAIVALVFAMGGGAYAAKKVIITSTSQIKPSVLKQLTGKTGPAGPAGPAGLEGSKGAKGDTGQAGKDGANGKSVAVASEPKGVKCKEAGVKVEVEGSGAAKYVCNGSPWTAEGTLPEEGTETGFYSTASNQSAGQALAPGESNILAPISLSIPLAAPLDKTHTIYVPAGNTGTAHCSASPLNGTAQDPKAESGYLCVYALATDNMEPSPLFGTVFGSFFKRFGAKTIPESTGSDVTGTSLVLNIPAAGVATGAFTWAATG